MSWITPLKSVLRAELEEDKRVRVQRASRARGVAPPRGARAQPDKPFNEKEATFIRWAAACRLSFTDVARELGRTRCSVGGRARRLGVSFHGKCGSSSPNWKRLCYGWGKKRKPCAAAP